MSSSTTTKRMSVDEKRKVILDIYHKTKAVYTEKEIITLATKAGVNTNTYVFHIAYNDNSEVFNIKDFAAFG